MKEQRKNEKKKKNTRDIRIVFVLDPKEGVVLDLITRMGLRNMERQNVKPHFE